MSTHTIPRGAPFLTDEQMAQIRRDADAAWETSEQPVPTAPMVGVESCTSAEPATPLVPIAVFEMLPDAPLDQMPPPIVDMALSLCRTTGSSDFCPRAAGWLMTWPHRSEMPIAVSRAPRSGRSTTSWPVKHWRKRRASPTSTADSWNSALPNVERTVTPK